MDPEGQFSVSGAGSKVVVILTAGELDAILQGMLWSPNYDVIYVD